MKGKMALIATLCTAVTIGGVYATWTFAQNNAASANTTVNVAMTGVNASTEKGTLSVMVMGANGFTLAVDDSNNDHYADIKKEGVVTVTFTPAASAPDDVKNNGIDVQCVISYAPYAGGPATLAEWTYSETQIFDIENDAEDPIMLSKSAAVRNLETGVCTWTIDASDVGIDLTDAFANTTTGVKIDTKGKYDALNEELAKGHFVLTVNEYVAP